jgi:hypothetical protein
MILFLLFIPIFAFAVISLIKSGVPPNPKNDSDVINNFGNADFSSSNYTDGDNNQNVCDSTASVSGDTSGGDCGSDSSDTSSSSGGD